MAQVCFITQVLIQYSIVSKTSNKTEEKFLWVEPLKLLFYYTLLSESQNFGSNKLRRNTINPFDWRQKHSPHSKIYGRYFRVSWLQVTVIYTETFLYIMVLNLSFGTTKVTYALCEFAVHHSGCNQYMRCTKKKP